MRLRTFTLCIGLCACSLQAKPESDVSLKSFEPAEPDLERAICDQVRGGYAGLVGQIPRTPAIPLVRLDQGTTTSGVEFVGRYAIDPADSASGFRRSVPVEAAYTRALEQTLQQNAERLKGDASGNTDYFWEHLNLDLAKAWRAELETDDVPYMVSLVLVHGGATIDNSRASAVFSKREEGVEDYCSAFHFRIGRRRFSSLGRKAVVNFAVTYELNDNVGAYPDYLEIYDEITARYRAEDTQIMVDKITETKGIRRFLAFRDELRGYILRSERLGRALSRLKIRIRRHDPHNPAHLQQEPDQGFDDPPTHPFLDLGEAQARERTAFAGG